MPTDPREALRRRLLIEAGWAEETAKLSHGDEYWGYLEKDLAETAALLREAAAILASPIDSVEYSRVRREIHAAQTAQRQAEVTAARYRTVLERAERFLSVAVHRQQPAFTVKAWYAIKEGLEVQ